MRELKNKGTKKYLFNRGSKKMDQVESIIISALSYKAFLTPLIKSHLSNIIYF